MKWIIGLLFRLWCIQKLPGIDLSTITGNICMLSELPLHVIGPYKLAVFLVDLRVTDWMAYSKKTKFNQNRSTSFLSLRETCHYKLLNFGITKGYMSIMLENIILRPMSPFSAYGICFDQEWEALVHWRYPAI